ncbi:ABC transporter ATP-binding protein [Apilactobacillus micheneri]|uniref:ABC transporter ATP-binding protein n=1 Tax=Apilactobacillus micheneri TaxID=1899430 RepID=A0ABY2Z0N4_9LACO|nr:ABC transporter ATP-binding protein [Apilactobacillus micheneri]TPR26369.1 ABC transporter ATP-binding protein [Apilactobacillus micheneri]TPR27123.1 ABC transporter ATP-binding protein [Apilactobacillus micheneri]TPR27371.1 ABC transporter ATP-binding protein [Apilactobacillus micheneri]TPR31886.1 ABC transporter ATP-binding protein [Apilactobacillus micheneri]TPR32290.1 ABC transporter ATP-binding protein [Apilactobacillus micheneri]
MTLIKLKDVCYSYPNTCGIKNLSININKGEFLCLMGANGSGKSTLLQILSGLKTTDNGQYFFKNSEITEKYLSNNKQRQKLHQQIGMVFQNTDVQLFNPSVYEEIAFGPKQLGLSQNKIIKRVNDCLKLTNCEKFRDRIPYQLSGGEKKRVALASVLALNPEILLLDEPLNGLTISAQREMLNLIRELQEAGKTIIMASHNYQQIKDFAQRFIIFKENHTVDADLTQIDIKNSPDRQKQLMNL